jgi:hypothetical protein
LSSIAQNLTQVQVGGGRNQTQTADQWAVNIQIAEASSEVAQTSAVNLNDVEIPDRGLWNPALNQSNAVGVASQMNNISSIDQAITQAASGPVTWVESAEQSARIVQSGTASALGTNTGFNVAGWTGPMAPEETGLPAPTTLEPLQTISGARAFAAAPTAADELDQPVRPSGGSVVGPATPRHPGRHVGQHVSGKPSKRGHGATSTGTRFAPGPGSTLISTPASAPTRSTPRASTPQAPGPQLCMRALCRDGSQIGGTPRSPSSGAFADLTRPFKLAAPGVGRLLGYAPTLGRSVDIAAFERPG